MTILEPRLGITHTLLHFRPAGSVRKYFATGAFTLFRVEIPNDRVVGESHLRKNFRTSASRVASGPACELMTLPEEGWPFGKSWWYSSSMTRPYGTFSVACRRSFGHHVALVRELRLIDRGPEIAHAIALQP
jgi:hypothetical protein